MSSTARIEAERSPAIVYPALPEAMCGRGPLGTLRLFGPGAIMAAVTIGSGETLFASRSGAIFGYSLLWFIVLAIACKLIQVYTGARYMVLTGEHPMEAWVRLPGPRGWFPAFLGGISIFCFPFWMGGLAKMLGTAGNWIIGLQPTDPRQQLYASLFGTFTLAVAAGLTLWQTYGVLEKAQMVVVGVLLASILAAVVVAPVDWVDAARGLLGLDGLLYPDWVGLKYREIGAEPLVLTMVIFMGAIGGGTQDYIGYLGFFREKGWGALGAGHVASAGIDPSPANIAAGRRWLRAPMIDVFIGFVCVILLRSPVPEIEFSLQFGRENQPPVQTIRAR